MDKLIKWLRVELLRCRSFDWGPGCKRWRRLKDGVMQFSSSYPVGGLVEKVGMSVDELLTAIESPPVQRELEEKAFTIGWTEKQVIGDARGTIYLTWLEEGIAEWKTETTEGFFEENGTYFRVFEWTERIVYLDGTERVMPFMADKGTITKEQFDQGRERILQAKSDPGPGSNPVVSGGS